MRKIKFRGKNINKKEWVYGDLVVIEDGMHNVVRTKIITHCFTKSFQDGGFDHYSISTLVEPETVSQFTGFLDKNGNEIYEDDIMGLPKCDANGIEYKNRYVRVVEWINDGFFLVEHCEMGGELQKYGDRLALEISLKSRYAGIARCFKERGLDYAVIGNIHDNPELLND